MTQPPNPPLRKKGKELYESAYQWMGSVEEGWEEGLRYLNAYPNAFAKMKPEKRYRLLYVAAARDEPRFFEKARRVLMAGCRWDDEIECLIPIKYGELLFFAQKEFRPAVEWLELFRLGGGLRLNKEIDIPDTVAGAAASDVPLWQALAVKAQEDARHQRGESQLPLILAAAKEAHMPVEGGDKKPLSSWECQNIAETFFRIHAKDPVKYLCSALPALLDANVDIARVWENPATILNSDHRAFKAECDARGKTIRAALLSGVSQAMEKDARTIACLGQLPQLVKDVARASASEELLQACNHLPPYYRQKYRHTLASLPRLAPVEESALAGYARGGAV